MRDKSYLPKPARREYIAKKNSNKKRPLGIQSEDPTYITTYKGARSLIRKVDRDDLLQAMLRSYLNV